MDGAYADALAVDSTASDASTNVDAAPDGPVNLIANGDFSQGLTYWHLNYLSIPDSSIPYSIDGGQLCIPLAAAPNVLLGWPADPAMGARIVANNVYVVSYRAWTTISATEPTLALEGPALGSGHNVQVADSVTTSVQTFAHPFTTDAGSDADGVAFVLQNPSDASPGDQICFSNVSLAASP
jgi:hypothetical protein